MGSRTDKAQTDQVQQDIAETRADLGQTVQALADKTDVKARAKDATAQVSAKAQDVAGQTGEAAKKPAVWGPVGAALLTAGTAIILYRRRKAARTPQGRAKRAWHKVADPVADRLHR